MADSSSTPPDDPNDQISLADTIALIKYSGTQFIQARKELAAIEAKEATQFGVKKLVAGILAAFFGLVAYALLLVFGIGWISHLLGGKLPAVESALGGSWPIATCIIMLIHLIAAVICVDRLRAKPKQTFFAHTRAELEKDKQWLQELKSKKES